MARTALGLGLGVTQGGGIFSTVSPASLFASGAEGVWYDPSDFSTLFQDSAGTVPVTTVGQPIGRISDKSGRGHHLTQAIAGARPTLGQDLAGNYYINGDGVGTYMKTSVFASVPQPLTMCIAQKFNTLGSTAYVFDDSDGSSRFALAKLGSANLSAFAGAQLNVDGDNYDVSVFDGVYNGASSSFKKNGGADINGDAGANGLTGLTVGARFTNIQFHYGRIYGLVVVAGSLSASNRNALRSWMNSKSSNVFSTNRTYFSEGDSITAGADSSENFQNGWAWGIRNKGPKPLSPVMYAVSGSTMADIEARQAALVSACTTSVGNGIIPIVSLLTGANDVPATVGAANTFYDRIVVWSNAVRATGAKVILCTSTGHNPATYAAYESTGRPQLNTRIRGDATKYDALCDFAADARLNVWSGTYFDDDLHPNDAGHEVMYEIMLPAYSSL
jgi:lysophospholipase L1-like esterase